MSIQFLSSHQDHFLSASEFPSSAISAKSCGRPATRFMANNVSHRTTGALKVRRDLLPFCRRVFLSEIKRFIYENVDWSSPMQNRSRVVAQSCPSLSAKSLD